MILLYLLSRLNLGELSDVSGKKEYLVPKYRQHCIKKHLLIFRVLVGE